MTEIETTGKELVALPNFAVTPEPLKTATPVLTMVEFNGVAIKYRLNPPYESTDYITDEKTSYEYVIVSSIEARTLTMPDSVRVAAGLSGIPASMFDMPMETMVFPADDSEDEHGEPTGWVEIGGGREMTIEDALFEMGYEIVDGDVA